MSDKELEQKVEESGIYKGLVELDIMLQKAVDSIDKAFDGFDNLEEASIKYAQDKIDKACIQISNKINKTLEQKKKSVCEALKKKYQQVLDSIVMLKPIIDLLSLNISIDTIVTGLIKTIQAFAQPYIKPYEDAIKFISEFTTKATPLLLNITNNTAELMQAPEKAQQKIQNINPQLNLDKLQISFIPPDISDIIG